MKSRDPAVPDDLAFYGSARPSDTHAITLPQAARADLAMQDRPQLFLFGSKQRKQLIVTKAPPAPELLELLTRRDDQGGTTRRRARKRKPTSKT